MSASIDAYAFHMTIILGVCAVSYWLLDLAKDLTIPVVKDISIWAYCIIVMFFVWGAMSKLNVFLRLYLNGEFLVPYVPLLLERLLVRANDCHYGYEYRGLFDRGSLT